MKPNEFVTADTHFGHANIIRHARRPFADVEAMNEALIARWNARVGCDDYVYVLGDFALTSTANIVALRARLNGRLCLVRGNHDKSVRGPALDAFEWVRDYAETRTEDGTTVVMSHFPFAVWNKSHHGAWHLHGHSHGSYRPPHGRILDVGVDNHPEMAPFSFDEVARHMAARRFEAVDHHRA